MMPMKERFQTEKFRQKRLRQFWSRIDSTGGRDSCWEWRGCRSKGYGSLTLQNRRQKAHRVVYELTFGPIPDGLFVCHRCDNPPCCNPRHLFLGTDGDNIRDMHSKGRGNIRERNGAFKIPVDIVAAIRTEAPRDYRLLAEKYGVSQMHVWNIINGNTRRHG